MVRDKIEANEIGKTGALLGVLNMLLAPLYWVDSKLGITMSIFGTGLILYKAHELGKSKRPIENAVNKANSFFGSATGDPSTEVHNAIANVAKGGEALFDEVLPQNKHKRT